MRTCWLGFGLALSALPASPSRIGPAVATRSNEIEMSQEPCALYRIFEGGLH